ncbi:MAG TPA: hypothetical protein VM848_02405 [Acidimicrobiia bacterium]|nr:hypothetical protein [Acidimicrobiia bacterium]
MTTPPGDDERFEHIPWEHVGPTGDRNKMILYGLAGAVLIAGLTAAVVGDRGASTDLVATPTTTTPTIVTMIEATTAPSPTSTAPGASAPNDDQPDDGQFGAWSEADLRAFPVETLATEAAALAEWLASDFFTIDGGTQITADLEGILPEGSVLPEAPVGTRSFVEWARAVSVEESTPGLYEVLVLVRRLAAAEGESYRRIAPIGVVISLTWTEGGWSVTDLPVLAEAPLLVQAPAWSEDEVPAEIIAAATASTGGAVLAGIQVGDNWRLVIQMVDLTGVSWPLVTWWDGTGNRIPAPSEPARGSG